MKLLHSYKVGGLGIEPVLGLLDQSPLSHGSTYRFGPLVMSWAFNMLSVSL